MNTHGPVQPLLLLVGSNPLPNYLAAMALTSEQVWLVHSSETENPMHRLKSALHEDLGEGIDIRSEKIDDPFDTALVQSRIGSLIDRLDQPHLHYTGGTKVMSSHAVKEFYDRNGQRAQSSYLDEPHRCLRFDDGNSRTLNEYGVTLTLDRALQLHGVTQELRSSVAGGPVPDDAERLATAVMQRPELADTLYEQSQILGKTKKPSKALNEPFDPSEFELNLSVTQVPESADWCKDQFKAWYKFLGGEWLEEWVARRIRDLQLDGMADENVVTGVNCRRTDTGREFEVDVAVLRDQRAYFISSTTHRKIGLCKSKAFEITARARQMGGDLARSAIVCLLDGEDSKGKFVEQLRGDIADVWGATNTPRVFGLEDVRNWAGHYV